MRSTHPWFTSKAGGIWKAQPGRSILAVVPVGCNESHVGTYLIKWLPENFPLPNEYKSFEVAVSRVVPDAVTSCSGFLSQLAKSFGLSHAERLEIGVLGEPSEALEAIIDAVHANGRYPVAVIERFHSFAHVADDALLSMLSRMRSLEQSGTMTTVALSPVSYTVMRRQMSSSLPFVNSSYGDNHDRAVMSPLSFQEFEHAAKLRSIGASRLEGLFALGGGPDAVFQAIIDEGAADDLEIVERCAIRTRDTIERFIASSIGSVDENISLLERICSNSASKIDADYICALPERDFFFPLNGGGLSVPPILSKAIRSVLDARRPPFNKPKKLIEDAKTRVLLISANSLEFPLDLENEIRAMEREIDTTLSKDRIVITNCHAATPDDVVRHLRKHNPHIVHFSGHGTELGLILRDDAGGEIEVSGVAIANTFRGRAVRLVVFNVCSSQFYAQSVADHVEAVICTTESVEDLASRRFTAAFYRTIGDGFSVEDAFRDGCNAVELYDLGSVFAMFGDGTVKFH